MSRVEVWFTIATVTLLAVVFLPSLARPRVGCRLRMTCESNLKQIGLAYRIWSNDCKDDQFPFAASIAEGGTMELVGSPQVFRHFQALSNQLHSPKVLVCPRDSKRQRATNFAGSFNTNLSYFVAFDADGTDPERLLSGDRNITGGTLTNGFLRLLQPTNEAGWSSEIHNQIGSIGLSDGSAMQMTPAMLRRQLQWQTNVPLSVIRLGIP